MNNRPYLDQIATSAHLPKQPGQNGFCSKTLIPDLSCTGLKSELEAKKIPITTDDGKITKQFKIKAYLKMRECQRGLNVLNSKEEIFKIDHRQYIDSLLGSIESDKKDKHERRMRHWKKDKNNLGFGSSFEFRNDSSNINDKINSTSNEYLEDFEDELEYEESFVEYGTVIPVDDCPIETGFDALNSHVVETMKNNSSQIKFIEGNHNSNSIRYNHNNKSTSEPLLLTAASIVSNKSVKPTKKLRTYSTMAFFESLLETTNSPSRKFGGGN